MTLRTKLLLAQIPLAIALLAVGGMALLKISELGANSTVILKDNYRSVLAAQRMKDALDRLDGLAPRAILDGSAAEQSRLTAEMSRHFERELDVQEGNITEPNERQVTRELRAGWLRYRDQLASFFAAAADEQRAGLAALEQSASAVRAAIDVVLTINQDAMVRKSERAARAATQAGTTFLILFATALALACLAAMVLLRRILQPLELLTTTVSRIGKGDFALRVDMDGRDEVSELARTVNTMAIHLDEYRRSSLGDLLLAQQASQAAIDSLPDPVVVFDRTGAVLDVNAAGESLLGLGARRLGDIAENVRSVVERVRDHVLGGKGVYVPSGFDEAVVVLTADGERYLMPRATPVLGEGGEIAGATVALQDVTRARLIDELREDMVATVAHELRTPLTSLWMAIHMCLEQVAGPLTGKQADLLYAARDDCQRLQTMVDAMLDLARIRSGKMDLKREPTPAELMIDAALELQRHAADDKHVTLEVSVPPGLADVTVDRQRIELVLSNLLSNAVRHTPPGGAIRVEAASAAGFVRIAVVDNGEGVPEEYRRLVFERFVRLPGKVSGGAGLGLSICKEIVESHGGEIGVEETSGGGATFWFTVPLALPVCDASGNAEKGAA